MADKHVGGAAGAGAYAVLYYKGTVPSDRTVVATLFALLWDLWVPEGSLVSFHPRSLPSFSSLICHIFVGYVDRGVYLLVREPVRHRGYLDRRRFENRDYR